MEIARLKVSIQRHIDKMQETTKVNYVQYRKSSRKKSKPGEFQQHTASGSSGGSSGNAGNPSKHGGKGKNVPLPSDILIGTVYCNYHRPALIVIFIFPGLLPKILRPSSQERACPTRTYVCLAKHNSK